MLSTPPATTMSAAPDWISRAALIVACMPEPHRRLTVWPWTSTGKPASSRAIRATLRLSSPAWLAQPRITSSTSAGLTRARSHASFSTMAARSSGRTPFSCPPYLPIGVRAVATITASAKLLLGASGEEFLHARGELSVCHLRLLEVRLELDRLLVGRLQGTVDRSLCARQGLTGLRRDVAGELAHLLFEALGGNDAVDEAQPVGVRRAQGLPGEEHLERHTEAREARQEVAGSAFHHEPDVDERLREVSLGRPDPDVARQREARADAQRRTVQRRYHRLGHCSQPDEHRAVLLAKNPPKLVRRSRVHSL